MKACYLKNLLKLTLDHYWFNEELTRCENLILKGYKVGNLSTEETNQELQLSAVVIKGLDSATVEHIDEITDQFPRHLLQLLDALTQKLASMGKGLILYCYTIPILIWVYLAIQRQLDQNRTVKHKPIDTVIERPTLALGYDLNTPPTAPPFTFNLVYYSLKTDFEGNSHERFATSRS